MKTTSWPHIPRLLLTIGSLAGCLENPYPPLDFSARHQVDRYHCGGWYVECEPDDDCIDGVCSASPNWALWPVPPSPREGVGFEIEAEHVEDPITGLAWQRSFAVAASLEEAQQYCEALEVDGGGWLLPTRIELVSIVDYSRHDPAIDTDVFPDTPSAPFWHRPWPRPRNTGTRPMSFLDGADWRHGLDGPSGTETHVRCVRRPAPAGPMGDGHYEISAETVLDRRTGLRWQRVTEAHREHGVRYDWAPANAVEANAICAELELGGYTDWRLPTLMELTTLIPVNPYPLEFYDDLPRVTWSYLDPRAFPEDITASLASDYWTSTRNVASPNPDSVWVLDFSSPSFLRNILGSRIRCVRNED